MLIDFGTNQPMVLFPSNSLQSGQAHPRRIRTVHGHCRIYCARPILVIGRDDLAKLLLRKGYDPIGGMPVLTMAADPAALPHSRSRPGPDLSIMGIEAGVAVISSAKRRS